MLNEKADNEMEVILTYLYANNKYFAPEKVVTKTNDRERRIK